MLRLTVFVTALVLVWLLTNVCGGSDASGML
jgi:hypothetical protein